MDLSGQEEMDKAVALLHEIDYLALLREAEHRAASGPGENKLGLGSRRTAGAKETEQLSEVPEERAGSNLEYGHGNVEGSSDEGVSDAKQYIHGRSTSASPKQAHSQHKHEATREAPKGANQDPSPSNTTTTTSPSPAIQALRSLTRTISPPPTSSHSKVPQSTSLPTPLSITLHSLGVFPSPSSARVFFAHPIDPTRRLKIFSTLIRERFNAAGLILDQRPLVLHATVANLIYAKRDAKDAAKRAGRARREGGHAVDAREILRFFNGDGGEGGEVRTPPQPDERIARESAGGIEFEVSGQSKHSQHVVSGEEAASASAASEGQVQLRAFRHPHPVPYIWARDIPITSIRICKMGAEPSDKPGWELEYRAVAEEVFLPEKSQET